MCMVTVRSSEEARKTHFHGLQRQPSTLPTDVLCAAASPTNLEIS
jgi:hypothetical protein